MCTLCSKILRNKTHGRQHIRDWHLKEYKDYGQEYDAFLEVAEPSR